MGRPPCCDKDGIKKGPWTPEEDIILVSYIQEHGPGNWRSVPTNTGLLRCSKSCRLRWTNYLRPGIKRGNFTPHEEGMIIHLQALLGNKWAAIASYLPQRTDNDIKNYWNTHLKKKLKKFQLALDPSTNSIHQFVSKSSFMINDQRKSLDSSSSTTYASSTENISRLLEGWMRSSEKNINNKSFDHNNDITGINSSASAAATAAAAATTCFHGGYRPKTEQEVGGGDLMSHEELVSIFSFENMNNVAWENSTCDDSTTNSKDNKKQKGGQNTNYNNNPPLSFLENWILDENSAGQVGETNQMMELPSIF